MTIQDNFPIPNLLHPLQFRISLRILLTQYPRSDFPANILVLILIWIISVQSLWSTPATTHDSSYRFMPPSSTDQYELTFQFILPLVPLVWSWQSFWLLFMLCCLESTILEWNLIIKIKYVTKIVPWVQSRCFWLMF